MKTAYGEPSLTVKLFTLSGRSSSNGVLTVSGVPVVLVAKNTSPVPSSLIAPTPVTAVPPVFVAIRLTVSLLSPVGSLVTAVRTNKPPAGIAT